MDKEIYQVYKGEGMLIITQKEHPVTEAIFRENPGRFDGENKLTDYYLPDEEFKSVVMELYDATYPYETVQVYDKDKKKILDINKLY